MKARSSSDSKLIKSGHTTPKRKKRKTTKEKDCSTLPNHLLRRISNEILDHTKQLGLFDEMRLKLLANIEISKEFFTLEKDFRREVESFCSHVDLNLPRSKLRERLNVGTLYKSGRRLEEHVHRISREHRHEFRKLYNQQAIDFLKRVMNKSTTNNSTTIPTSSTTTTIDKLDLSSGN